MKIPIYQVDAFTNQAFKGNPAAVCPLNQWLAIETMQAIAMENNLSETAFFVKESNGFGIRWFTPVSEIALAGHPTLATAHVIFAHLGFSGDEITFHTQKSGDLRVRKLENMYHMDFPAKPPQLVGNGDKKLNESLGKLPLELHIERDYLAVFETEEDVLQLKPDFRKLKEINQVMGVIATAPGNDCDFVSRFFTPQMGIDEDPVTGSAHCISVPYWAKKLNKQELYARQISARGGDLYCSYKGDRVGIAGQAVTFMVGEINI